MTPLEIFCLKHYSLAQWLQNSFYLLIYTKTQLTTQNPRENFKKVNDCIMDKTNKRGDKWAKIAQDTSNTTTYKTSSTSKGKTKPISPLFHAWGCASAMNHYSRTYN